MQQNKTEEQMGMSVFFGCLAFLFELKTLMMDKNRCGVRFSQTNPSDSWVLPGMDNTSDKYMHDVNSP